MANKGEHFVLGAIVSGGAFILYKKYMGESIDPNQLVGYSLIGGAFALLPDMLEPAISPTHRGLFHSIILGLGIINANQRTFSREEMDELKKCLMLVSSAGYGSHLLADAQTPAGLPLI